MRITILTLFFVTMSSVGFADQIRKPDISSLEKNTITQEV